MQGATPTRTNLWELAVLAFLKEQPMHPYEMQRLLRERHKDELLVLKKGSLYHAINRLLHSGLIEAVEIGRDGKRPERTTYRITTGGERTLQDWVLTMISVPAKETSDFMAAMSFLVYLSPDETIPHLHARVVALEHSIAGLEASLEALAARVQRINLLEVEYLCAMRKAELEWARNLVNEIQSGRFRWNLQTILLEAEAARKLRTKPATT